MDLGIIGSVTFDWKFISALFSIVLIDLILAGDNAVVIAMAVRSLPHDRRRSGILLGATAAVLLRVIATFFVAQLLNVSYVKLAGGVLILWIAVKLFVEGAPEDERDPKATSIWEAIKIIVIADITMSMDNMLAVGGASHGNLFLLLFGLALSIPFVVVTSNLLSLLMDRYPVIIYIGAAILGKVGGEMMITDPFTVRLLPAFLLTPETNTPVKGLQYGAEALFAAGVLITGKLWMRQTERKEIEGPAVLSKRPAHAVERPAAILTISRQYGSGGREIGQAVARELSYTYVDRDVLLKDIRGAGMKWEQWAAALDEHSPTVWERYDWSFRGFAALEQWHILENACRGGVVIMGRGGNVVLREIAHAYRVRIESPLDVRIERVVRREQIDRETAKWLCEKTDKERANFLHTMYATRWDDPAEYDRIFTVTESVVDAEVSALCDTLTRMAVTEEAMNVLRFRTAAAKVKAGIATNPALFVPLLDVVAEGEALVLRGITHTLKEQKAIENEARRLAGNLLIRSEMHFRK